MKRKLSFLERFATVPHVVWSVLFIVGPLLFVLWYAFTDTKGEFTFSNISLLSSYSHIFVLSICFALVATAICLLIGYPLAFVMSRAKPSVQKILMILLTKIHLRLQLTLKMKVLILPRVLKIVITSLLNWKNWEWLCNSLMNVPEQLFKNVGWMKIKIRYRNWQLNCIFL